MLEIIICMLNIVVAVKDSVQQLFILLYFVMSVFSF